MALPKIDALWGDALDQLPLFVAAKRRKPETVRPFQSPLPTHRADDLLLQIAAAEAAGQLPKGLGEALRLAEESAAKLAANKAAIAGERRRRNVKRTSRGYTPAQCAKGGIIAGLKPRFRHLLDLFYTARLYSRTHLLEEVWMRMMDLPLKDHGFGFPHRVHHHFPEEFAA